MDTYNMKLADIKPEWYLIDAKDKVLGRLASKIAMIVRGKNKATFTPHLNCGDHVVVINAAKIKVTGNKMTKKIYRNHTNYPGGLKETTMQELLQKHPAAILEKAVKGMLPHRSLGNIAMKNLRVFPDDKHTFQNKPLKELKI